MWAILLQLLSLFVGWQIIRHLPLVWRRTEALAASFVVGTIVSALVFFGIALIFGWPFALPATVALLASGSVLSQWKLKTRAGITSKPYITRNGWQRWAAIGSMIVASFTVSYLVIQSYQFPAPDGSWYSNGNTWGDSALHVAFIDQFSHGSSVDLVLHQFGNQPLRYPFIADFWSGVLMRTTDSWAIALLVPSLLMTLALLQLLFSFGYRLLGSARAAWLAWLLLVLSGSLQVGFILSQTLLANGIDAFTTAVGYNIDTVTHDGYINFVYSHLLPQRSYLFGMALFIVIMTGLLEFYRHAISHRPKSKKWSVSMVVLGILGGLLPIVHTHSFIVLVGILGLVTVVWLIKKHRVPTDWWIFLSVVTVIAAPLMVWQLGGAYHEGFGHWIQGWTSSGLHAGHTDPWILYWLKTFGWLCIILLIGWYWLWRQHAKAEIWITYIAGIAIFAVANLYVFQPTYWDNMKLFEYASWSMMLISAYLFALWSRKPLGGVIVAILMVSLTTTGAYTLVSGLRMNFELLSVADAQFGTGLRQTLPDDAYVLTVDRHNNPATMLGGAKVFVSYGGWYNLYGNNWQKVLQDRSTMLGGYQDAQTLINQNKLTHAIFNDSDTTTGEVNKQFFDNEYRQVSYTNGWYVYDLTKTAP